MHKPFHRIAAAVALIAALAGCADAPPPGARLTYETAPLGATLHEGGESLGVAPVMRSYAGAAGDARIRTPEVTAVWPSGAKTVFWTFLKPGDDNVTTLARPATAPGLAADLDNAQKYMNVEARAKEQARRDLARNSARCQAQQHSGRGAIDDCN